MENKVVQRNIGSKTQERRLLSSGGVEVRPVVTSRQVYDNYVYNELQYLFHIVARPNAIPPAMFMAVMYLVR